MRLLLVPDLASPNGDDAFCREIAKRAPARGHECAVRAAPRPEGADWDAAVINGPQAGVARALRAAGRPVVVRLIESGSRPGEDPRAAAREADRVLVPSAYMRGLAAGWGIPEERVFVVPYAYDRILAQQIALVTLRAARPTGFGLVSAGVLDAESRPGFETLLAAVARLRLDCHVAVIGEGPELPALKERARAMMLDGRASFLGELPHDKKMEYLRAAKVYVEPSGRQGFPSLALHAMSEGCPVVGAAAGAVPELVRDGENGLLFPPGDAAALAEQILNLATTPGLSLKLIAGGVRAVEARSWDATVAAALDAVEGLPAAARG